MAEAPSLLIETTDMEAQRESNKKLLISRRKDITTFLRTTEQYSAAEQRDQEKTTEILVDLHTTTLALGETKSKALKLIDKYDIVCTEIEKIRETTKNTAKQLEENPANDIAKKHMASFATRLREIIIELSQIHTDSLQYTGDLGAFADSLHQIVTFGGLRTNISLQGTTFSFQGTTFDDRVRDSSMKAVIEKAVGDRHDNIRKQWTEFQNKTKQQGICLLAIDFKKHTAQITEISERKKTTFAEGTSTRFKGTLGLNPGRVHEASIQEATEEEEEDAVMHQDKDKTKRGDRRKKQDKYRRQARKEKKRTKDKQDSDSSQKSSSSSSRPASGHSGESSSAGSSVRSLNTQVRRIEERKEKAKRQREQIAHSGQELDMAAKEYSTHAQQRVHTLQQYQYETLIGKMQQLFQSTPEGEKQLEEIHMIWGTINSHSVGEEQALTKLHTATKQAVEGFTEAMHTQEKYDQERELLLRKHSHKLREVEELFATLRRDQWDKQLEEHIRTWSFKGFPRHFGDMEKKLFILGIAGHFQNWATFYKKGPIHLGGVSTSGLEGEFTDKLKLEKPKNKLNQSKHPCIHFQSIEEGELFGEFAQTTAQLEHWIAYATGTTTIRVKVAKTTAAGSVPEACCYWLRILQHALEKQEVINNHGEYTDPQAPDGNYYCRKPNFTATRGPSHYQENGRVRKGDFILAVTDAKPPYTEEILARAYVDPRDETAYKKPGIVIRLGEDHIHKICEATIQHLDMTIAECSSQAWGERTKKTHPSTYMSLELEDVVELTNLRAKAKKDIEEFADLSSRREIRISGDYTIGEHLEEAILYMTQSYWGAIAEGKLNFQDMSQSDGKAVTTTAFIDWNFSVRQQPSGEQWEHRGRSRSRRTDRGKGGKGDKEKGGDKGSKGDSKHKNTAKGRSDSEASVSTHKGKGKTDPKWDHSQRKEGDWVCKCGDNNYAWKEECPCGGTKDNRLAMWRGSTKTWDPADFDEERLAPGKPWLYKEKGQEGKGSPTRAQGQSHSYSHSSEQAPQYHRDSSHNPATSSSAMPDNQTRGESSTQRGNTGNEQRGHDNHNEGLKATTIREQSKEITERVLGGETMRDEWVGMICDPQWVEAQEWDMKPDGNYRHRKSSICRYFASGRGCKKGEECNFSHVSWPENLAGIMQAHRQGVKNTRRENRDRHEQQGDNFPPFQNPVNLKDPNLIHDQGGIEIRQVGYEHPRQTPMQPTGKGNTPPPPAWGYNQPPPAQPPSPPAWGYNQPPPAQLHGAQRIQELGTLRTQGNFAAEQAAQNERNIRANNAASGHPAQREGTSDPWQRCHDPWQGTNSGQYQQSNWTRQQYQQQQPSGNAPQQQPNWGGPHAGHYQQPMSANAAALHADNISSAQEGGSCWGRS